MLLNLTNLRVLDSQPISKSARTQVVHGFGLLIIQANELYLEHVRSFNAKLEQLRQQHEAQIHLIQLKQRSLEQKSNTFKKHLMDSFLQLEATLFESRSAVMKECLEQLKIREDKAKAFNKTLDSIQAKFFQDIDKLIQQEKAKIHAEERALQLLKDKIDQETAEYLLSLSSTNNSQAKNGKPSLPEYK